MSAGGCAAWRYERFLPLVAKGRLGGRTYAHLVAGIRCARETEGRRIAVARIGRWYGLDVARAAAIHRTSVLSEAQEEADSLRFMRDPVALERWLPRDVPALPDGPIVFAGLHLGSPVLGFLYLRRRGVRDVHAMVRGLDESNPMPDAKRRWGQRKLAWVRSVADGGILGTDAESVAAARDHLCAGQAIFAALDVPGDVVSRHAVVEIHGERLLFSAGIVQLALLTRSTIVPIVALGGPRQMRVHLGAPIVACAVADPIAAVFAALTGFIDRFPGEWWMWPFLRSAPPGDGPDTGGG